MAINGRQPVPVLALFVGPVALITFQRTLLAWQTMLGFILLIILFIPIRRYTIGGGLPIELEPYRVVIALVLGCWIAALAADPQVRWRRTHLEAPIALFAVAILISLALNIPRVNGVSEIVLKQVSFFLSYFLVTYFVASVLPGKSSVDRMLKLLVGGATIVSILAIVEWKSGFNVFNGLGRVMPFLRYVDQGEGMVRGTGVRALGSAQHPIALGAALVMLLPLTVYLHKLTGKKIWFVCAAFLTLGALSTGSRTAAVMLIVLVVVFFWLRRDETIKMVPTLLALTCVVQVVMPGTIGTFKLILNPAYVVQEQSGGEGSGSGRLADIGPSLAEWSRSPLFGQGFGTRVPMKDFQEGGVQILDNQWLSSLLEVGAVGVIALMWLLTRAIRRLARQAREKEGPDAWLATTMAAGLTGFTVGMFTFDGFSFIQVTFLAFIMLGFTAVITREDGPLVSKRQLAAQARTAARAS
jgi:hypothetical protein